MSTVLFNGGSSSTWLAARDEIILRLRAEGAYEVIINEIPDILLDPVSNESTKIESDTPKDKLNFEEDEVKSIDMTPRTFRNNHPFTDTNRKREIFKSPFRSVPKEEKEEKLYRKELDNWKSKTAKCYSIINTALGPIPKAIIRAEMVNGDIYTAWVKLCDYYSGCTQTGLTQITEELKRLKREKHESVMQFVQRLMDIFTILETNDNPLGDHFQLMYLRNGIEDGYQGIKFSELLNSCSIMRANFNTTINMLVERETQIKRDNNRINESNKILFTKPNKDSNTSYKVESDNNYDNESQIKCAYCDKLGHTAQTCYKLIKYKSKAKKAENNKVQNQKTDNSKSSQYLCLQEDNIVLVSAKHDKNIVYLDSGASNHIFSNEKLFERVIDTVPIKINGVIGSVNINQGGNTIFGPAYYLPNGPNVLSIGKLIESGHKVVFDTNNKIFIVNIFNLNKKLIKLRFSALNNLFILNIDQNIEYNIYENVLVTSNEICTPTSVNEDDIMECHVRYGHINADTLIKCMDTNLNISDINKILSKCVNCWCGRETKPIMRKKGTKPSVVSNIGDKVHVDIFYIDKQPFMLCVDEFSKYLHVIKLKSRQYDDVHECIDKILRRYKLFKYDIKMLITDNEKSILSLEEDLLEKKVQISAIAPNTHVKLAEVNIKLIKNKMRTMLSDLPYFFPLLLLRFLVSTACRSRNIRNVNGSSPELIFNNNSNEINKNYFKEKFGQIAAFYNPYATNSLDSRMELGIILGFEENGVAICWITSRKEVVKRLKYKLLEPKELYLKAINRSFTGMQCFAPSELSTHFPDFDMHIEEFDNELNNEVNENLNNASNNDVTAIEVEENNINNYSEDNIDVNLAEYVLFNGDENQSLIKNSIKDELQQLVDLNVFGTDTNTFTKGDELINTHMINTKKYDTNGGFKKWKSRLVAGGNNQCFEGVTNSPTVNFSSVLIGLHQSVQKGLKLATIDIKGAYLNAKLDEDIWVKINRQESEILCKIDEKFNKYLNDKGCIIIKLNKALYGLKQSALRWYQTLKTSLLKLGYTSCKGDECLFKYGDNLITVHVDDMLLMATDENEIIRIKNHIIKEFKEITFNNSNKLEYLGINIIMEGDTIKLNQYGYIAKIMEKFNVTGGANYPSNEHLFKSKISNNQFEELNEVDIPEYHSCVMSLMFLAIRTRSDIVKEVTYLSTKVKNPAEQDVDKLRKILNYLKNTKEDCLSITKSEDKINIYVDASYNVHSDAKSHSGCAIFLGSNLIRARSSKQRIVTKSSTEAELVAIHDSLSTITNIIHILNELGFKDLPTLYQDNMSTLKLIDNGQTFKGRSNHINMKYYFIKQMIEDNQLKVEYKPTAEMKADILTKPLNGSNFIKMKNWLLNSHEVVP